MIVDSGCALVNYETIPDYELEISMRDTSSTMKQLDFYRVIVDEGVA